MACSRLGLQGDCHRPQFSCRPACWQRKLDSHLPPPRPDLQRSVINTDDKPFDFAAALHTYFEVLSIGQAKINGLKGLTYLDKVGGFASVQFVCLSLLYGCDESCSQ